MSKVTQRQKVFEALYRAGSRGATTTELCHPDVGGVRFGGRIKDLRDEGCVITTARERRGGFRYTLDRTQLPAGAKLPAGAATPAPPVAGPAEVGVDGAQHEDSTALPSPAPAAVPSPSPGPVAPRCAIYDCDDDGLAA